MKKKYPIVLFLRHKPEGQNSLEELAYMLCAQIPDIKLMVLPKPSTSLRNVIINICFARRNAGKVNHIFSPAEGYIAPFIKGEKIVTWHDVKTLLESPSKIKRWIRWTFLTKWPQYAVKHFTCISDFSRKELNNFFPYTRNRTEVIYNFYNPALTPAIKLYNTTSPRILHIGTAKRKNLEGVILALKGINCKLIVVGILSEIQQRLLKENAIQYENLYDVPYTRIIGLYKECDIVSFPSFYEGFGLPVIEANAVGRPVVTSKVGPISEVAGEAAVFVDPYDISSIRNGFLSLMQSEEKREKVVSQGFQNIQRFKLERIIQRYQEVYSSILDK